MSSEYVNSSLLPGEHVVHQGRIHKIVYLPGVVLFTVFLAGSLYAPSSAWLLILFPAMIASAVAFIQLETTELAVTNLRAIVKVGLISRRTAEMRLAKMENVQVDQSLLGMLCDFGTITIIGTGGTRERFAAISAPLEFRKAIQEQSHLLGH